MGRHHRFAAALAAISLAGLAVRVLYTVHVGQDVPFQGDAETYHLLARNLADGHGYIRPHEFELSGRAVPTAEFPPLFPGVLAVAAWAGAASVLSQKLVMSVVGSVTVTVIGLLGRRVAGPAVGLVAAGLAAVHPMLFQIDGALMAETLYVLLVATVLLAAHRAVAGGALRRWLGLGILIGLASLTRGEALLFLPLLVVPLAAGRRSQPPAPPRLRAERVVWAVAGAVLVVAPWTVRNYVRLDAFVPVASNSTGVLIGSNCPEVYAGADEGLWLFSCYGRADVEGLGEAEAFREYGRVGLDFVADNLDRLPRVLAVRWLRAWGLFRPEQQIRWASLEGRDQGFERLGTRLDWVLVPLAAAGAVWLTRRRLRVWPLLSTAVLVTITVLVTYGNQRFRVAAEPAIVVLAAVALCAPFRGKRAAAA